MTQAGRRDGRKAGHPVHALPPREAAAVVIYDHALATGFARGFEVGRHQPLALVVTIIAVRISAPTSTAPLSRPGSRAALSR